MPPKASACAFLGNVPCMRIYRQCTGIKACEFLDLRLRNIEHEEVDSGHWVLVNQIRNANATNATKIKAQHFAQAAKDLWAQRVPCSQPHHSCGLEPVESFQVSNIY